MKLLAVLALLFPLQAFSQAESCTACHGPNGEGNAQAGGPRIAGQPAAYLERQLAAYASGARQNQVMAPIAKGLSEQDRRSLAQHFSQLAARENPKASASTGSSSKNSRAETLARHGDRSLGVQACANCHGPDGTGLADVNPYLAGLSAKYLTASLHEWKSGTRNTDPSGQMSRIGKSLRDSDIQALASYYAALPPPQPREGEASVARQAGRNAATGASGPVAPTQERQGTGVNETEPATSGGSQGPGGGGTSGGTSEGGKR